MPNYKGHLSGGLLTALLLLYALSWWVSFSLLHAIQLVFVALLGSLFPDIDTKSQGQLLAYRLLAILLIILVVQQRLALALACSAFAMVPLIVHHRGLFHRVWFIALLCASVVMYAWHAIPRVSNSVALYVLFFFIGALSHIWLDVGLKRMLRN